MPNRMVHSGGIDPTQATTHLVIVLVSRMQMRGTGGTILSNGKGHFGWSGQSGPPSKLVPNIPVRPNRNGPFHLMYQPKFPELWVEWKAPLEMRKKPYKLLPVFLNSFIFATKCLICKGTGRKHYRSWQVVKYSFSMHYR